MVYLCPMTKYQPVSRRPIAEGFRATARLATSWCARYRIHPDTISYTSMIAAAAAAVCFWQARGIPALLIVGPLLCYVRLWFNMLDGMVALATGQASARGEVLNDLPDRASDVLIFAGLAQSGLLHPALAYWVALAAVLTAYVGLFGQATGGPRQFGGVMSKPWRMVALHLGAWITFGVWKMSGCLPRYGNLSVLDWTCLAILAGCVQTIIVRLKRVMVALKNK